MSRLMRYAPIAAILALVVAAAPPYPPTVPLPNDFAPEGIAIGGGSTFYVGSLADGDIYRGDLRTGSGALLVDAPAGRSAVGLKVDVRRHRIFVAGGFTGHAYVYDSRDGTPLADIPLSTGPTLLNDVVVTRAGAFFTDSFNPVLHKVPIAPDGSLGSPETLVLSGPAATVVGFPNLNGITATPNGDTLIVGHSNLGAMLTVDPATGASREIAVSGGSLIPGTNDGLLLDGRTLWVVENFAERLVGIRLAPDLSSGRVTSVVTDADVGGRFRIPTTVAEFGHRLALVNGRFDLGFPPPLGEGAPPGSDYDVVVLDKP